LSDPFWKEATLGELVESPPLAVISLDPSTGIRMLWLPQLFGSGALDDELRAELVAMLRFHALKLESRELDARMIATGATGTKEDA